MLECVRVFFFFSVGRANRLTYENTSVLEWVSKAQKRFYNQYFPHGSELD